MGTARTLVSDREKMSDETRYRSPRGYGQPQAQAGVESPRGRRGEDPLAELARLIGQEDPFAEFSGARAPRRPAAANGGANGPALNGEGARPAAPRAPATAPERPRGPVDAQRRTEVRSGDSRYAAQARGVPTRGSNDYIDADRIVSRNAPPTRPIPPRSSNGNGAAYAGYPDEAPRRHAPRPQPGPIGRTRDVRDEYDDDVYEARPAARPHRDDPRNYRRSERAPAEDPRYSRGRQQHAYQDYEDDYDPDYSDDGYLPEHADDVYDEVPRPRRRWGFYVVTGIVAASLVAVAGLGFIAYRSVFNTPSRPPVVTKSDAPNKIDPTKNAAAPNKTIQDRIAPTGVEQLLKREEQPADLTRTNPPQPMQYAPNPAANPQSEPAPPARAPVFTSPPQQTQQTPPANADQPRRVRTMTVRSDGTVVPNSAPPSNNTGPLPLNANQNSLEPETPTPPLPAARPHSAAPAPQRPVTASLAPATSPLMNPRGNYVVQVASHKTQEEAQAAWNALQQEHASIFNGTRADIRRVDLGDRGTFYRALVGPMNRDQANALCQNLKTAGGGCIVQSRN